MKLPQFLTAAGGLSLSFLNWHRDWLPSAVGPQWNLRRRVCGNGPRGGRTLDWRNEGSRRGYSTLSIVGDRLYVITNQGRKEESVLALNVKDGQKVWSQPIGKVGKNYGMDYPGARSTPTVDGDSIYALGSDGDLACLDAAKGEVRWHKSLRNDFDGTPGMWAYAESPLIDGDTLVCTPGGAGHAHRLLIASGNVFRGNRQSKTDQAAQPRR